MLRMTDAPPPYSPVDPQTPNPLFEAPPLREKSTNISSFSNPTIFVAPCTDEGINPATVTPRTNLTVAVVKNAPTRKPYDVYCARCQTLVHTKRRFVVGAFSWILFFALLVVFFPLCWLPFVLNLGKDVEHLCPQCESLLSVRRALRNSCK